MYAQVDAYALDGTAQAAIGEADDENNILGPVRVLVNKPVDENSGR